MLILSLNAWAFALAKTAGSGALWRYLVALSCIGATACSTNPAATATPPTPVAMRSVLEMRQEGVVMQQWDNSCAAAALATVLRFGLNEPADEKQVAIGMMRLTSAELVHARGGFSMLDMKLYAEARGFRATGLGRLSVQELSALKYPIVPLQTQAQAAHFVVVLSVSDDSVLIADPAFGSHRMALPDFLGRWRQGLALSIIEL